MRRISEKRLLLLKEVSQFRASLRRDVGRCELCLKPARPDSLDVHELVPGYLRAQALDKSFATMCLHRHCHNIIEMLTIPNQLAYFLRARPESFNIDLYWKLMARKWPSMDQVLHFLDEINAKDP